MDHTKFFIYFSEILGREVRDEMNRPVGILSDIVMKINGEIYPKAAGLIVKRGLVKKEFARINWEDLIKIGDHFVRVKVNPDKLLFQKERIKCDFTLCVDILDQQIVDTDNRKVVRVNDIHLLRVDNNLYLAHVDVGTRGLVRRLGWTPLIDTIVKLFNSKSPYLKREDLISWKNTHVLNLLGRAKNLLRLDVERQKISQIPATELADILEDLDIFEKSSLFKSLDPALQARVFADMATPQKAELIEKLNEQDVVGLLENIPSDEAADLLLRLPREQTRHLMTSMQTKISRKLRKLLEFSRNSAGGLMTMEYLTVLPTAQVKDAMQRVRENIQILQNVFTIYVIDEQNRLVGLTSLRNLISHDPEAPIMSACFPKKIFVRTDDQIEEIALLLEKYKLFAVPVLNEEDVLQGVVTIDDVLEELITIVWRKYREKI